MGILRGSSTRRARKSQGPLFLWPQEETRNMERFFESNTLKRCIKEERMEGNHICSGCPMGTRRHLVSVLWGLEQGYIECEASHLPLSIID